MGRTGLPRLGSHRADDVGVLVGGGLRTLRRRDAVPTLAGVDTSITRAPSWWVRLVDAVPCPQLDVPLEAAQLIVDFTAD